MLLPHLTLYNIINCLYLLSTVMAVVCRKGVCIYNQLKKLGSSVDWDRACFTMDPVSMFSCVKFQFELQIYFKYK